VVPTTAGKHPAQPHRFCTPSRISDQWGDAYNSTLMRLRSMLNWHAGFSHQTKGLQDTRFGQFHATSNTTSRVVLASNRKRSCKRAIVHS
jgi:hypothetical protein